MYDRASAGEVGELRFRVGVDVWVDHDRLLLEWTINLVGYTLVSVSVDSISEYRTSRETVPLRPS